MLLASILLCIATEPSNPIEFGSQALREVSGKRYSDIAVRVRPGRVKESYSVENHGGKILITGTDPVGVMYGELELAERIKNLGWQAWAVKTSGSPYLPQRGLNLFLTLPWNYAKHDTDYDVAALSDPDRWWFQNDDYWRTLLDLMAKSRLNWLDIHGAWDISVTDAPNLYAYFVTAPSFKKVGVPPSVKAANLARLNKVVSMAHARGIKVSLMSYYAGLKIPQNQNVPYPETERNVYDYTKEAVEQMIRQVPGLDGIGFRIGESGKSESFFHCYNEAVAASGRSIPLITRSWITRRQNVLPLARSSKDFTVEIKYNGEQWGAPYMVAGGRMANWYSYSFEDYLSDAGYPEENKANWPGWTGGPSGDWPGNPYKIVWQVRANGTHRIFPFFNPDWVRRSIREMKIGTASGYTIEGEDAYYPKQQDYYLADTKDKYVRWTHQRDELYWMQWGRLGYDPETPNDVFDQRVKDWFGREGDRVLAAWTAASKIVPLAYMAESFGPDHRDHAPELEWGGRILDSMNTQPFDEFSVRPVAEDEMQKALGVTDGRASEAYIAARLAQCGLQALDLGAIDPDQIPSAQRARFKEVRNAVVMLGYLGGYYANRIKAATELAAIDRLTGSFAIDSAVTDAVGLVSHDWQQLSESKEAQFYRPFTERLRMHTNTFHWNSEFKAVQDDVNSVLALPKAEVQVPQDEWKPAAGDPLKISWTSDTVSCSIDAQGVNSASLLVKPLPSSTFFHKIAMKREGGLFVATFDREPWGHCVAADVTNYQGVTTRVPSPFATSRAPYKIVPTKPGLTPQIYSTQEALRFLDPSVLSPDRYGMILVAPRAWAFNGFDNATKRKLLEPVRRGLDLVILQQDFASGRYKLDFLPDPPKVSNSPVTDVFNPDGALSLPKIEAPGVLWQRVEPTDGWTVYGNGGVASLSYGEGHVWIVMGRFMQLCPLPQIAQAIKTLLTSHGTSKPTVLVDAGTEGSVYTTSFWPDTMNVLGVPFETLGEVIAREQGMSSFEPVPGSVSDDDVLNGQGKALANAYLVNRVKAMASVPTPKTLADFEVVRSKRRKELMRTLGLDPLPARTPLNARVTGVIQREGYHIEKVVFESRPQFFVTAHVYKADSPSLAKLPVVMNVNGHWAHKKDEDRIQLRCAFQALQGYIAIAIDSPGFSFEGDSLIERRAEGSHFEFKLVEGGTNATGYYVWDAIRALDYMESRSDTDMSRVGITGASGGGLATLYAFAADDRYKAAVPVVYMSSMELAPDNGCPCNHVPGTCQVGDRSDVISIQAPKPVYIMGAQNDGEFPPDAMRLTHAKMAETWKLFGKDKDTFVQIYPGPHDYNQAMRESMIGFFNKYLRQVGDGSPVPQPKLTAIDPEDRQLLVLDPPAPSERTMEQLSKECLERSRVTATTPDVFGVNGGLPVQTNPMVTVTGSGSKRAIVFQPLPGLKTPGILLLPSGEITAARIVVDDAGKAGLASKHGTLKGTAVLYLDVIGTGELSNVEIRYPVYMGTSLAFLGGWQIARAVEAMHKYSANVSVVARGPLTSQAAMYAGLMNASIASVTASDCLKTWEDVYRPDVPESAIQPRANLLPPLDDLRARVKHGSWTFLP